MRRKKVKTYIQKKKKLFIVYLTFIGIVSACLMANALFTGNLFAEDVSTYAANSKIDTTVPVTILNNEYYINGNKWKVVNTSGSTGTLAKSDGKLNGVDYSYLDGVKAVLNYQNALSPRDKQVVNNTLTIPSWNSFSSYGESDKVQSQGGSQYTIKHRPYSDANYSYWLTDSGSDQNGTNANYKRSVTNVGGSSGLIITSGVGVGDSLKLMNGSEYSECTDGISTSGYPITKITVPTKNANKTEIEEIWQQWTYISKDVKVTSTIYECPLNTVVAVNGNGILTLPSTTGCKISYTMENTWFKKDPVPIFQVGYTPMGTTRTLTSGETLVSQVMPDGGTLLMLTIQLSPGDQFQATYSLMSGYDQSVKVADLPVQRTLECSAQDYQARTLPVRPIMMLNPTSFLFASTSKATGTVTTGSGNYLTAKDANLTIGLDSNYSANGYTISGNSISVMSAVINGDEMTLPLTLAGNQANTHVLVDDGTAVNRYAGGATVNVPIDLSKISGIKKENGKYITQDFTLTVYNNDVTGDKNIDYVGNATTITVSLKGAQEIVYTDTNKNEDKTIELAYGDASTINVHTLGDNWDKNASTGGFAVNATSNPNNVIIENKVPNLQSGTMKFDVKANAASGTALVEINKGGDGTQFIASNTLKLNLKFKKKDQSVQLTSAATVELIYGNEATLTAKVPDDVTNYDKTSGYDITVYNEQGVVDNTLLQITPTLGPNNKSISYKVTPLKGGVKATVKIKKKGDGMNYNDSTTVDVAMDLKLRPQVLERVTLGETSQLTYGNALDFGAKVRDSETNWDQASGYEIKMYKNEEKTENNVLGKVDTLSLATNKKSISLKTTALRGVDTLRVEVVKKGDGLKYKDSDPLIFKFVLNKRALTLETKAVSGYTGQTMPTLTYSLLTGEILKTDQYPTSIEVKTEKLNAASDSAVDANKKFNAIGTWKLVFSDAYAKDTSASTKIFKECYDVSFKDWKKDASILLTVKQDNALQSWLDVSPACTFNASLATCWNNSNVTFKIKDGKVIVGDNTYDRIAYKNGSTYGSAKVSYVLSDQNGTDIKQASYNPTGYTFHFVDSSSGAYSSDITSRNIRIDSTKPNDLIFSIEDDPGILSTTQTAGRRFYNDGFYVKSFAKDEQSGIREETFKAVLIEDDGSERMIGGTYADKAYSTTIPGIQTNTKSMIAESLNFNFKKDFKGTIKIATKNEAGLETTYTSPLIVNETPLEADVVVDSLTDTNFISQTSKDTYRFAFEVKAPHSGIKSVRYGIKDDNGRTYYEQPDGETLNGLMNVVAVQNTISDTTTPTFTASLNQNNGILFKSMMDQILAMNPNDRPEYLTLRVYVVTNAGNTVTEDFKILFDFDAPTITKFLVTDEKAWVNTDKQVMLTLSDGNGSGIDHTTLKITDPKGNVLTPITMLGLVSFSAPMNGTYQIEVQDKAGNKGTLVLPISKIDPLKPVIKNITYEPGGTQNNEEVLKQKTVSFAMEDPGTVDQVSGLDGNPIIITSSVAGLELPVITKNTDGTYSFAAVQNAIYTVQMKDNAGNVLETPIEVQGIVHPDFTLALSATNNDVDHYYQNANITYEFRATEGSKTVGVKHVNVMYNSFDGIQEKVLDQATNLTKDTFTVTKNGTYTVTITTTGGAVISETIAITQMLLEKPHVRITSDVPDNTWSNHNITIALDNTNRLLEGKGDIQYQMRTTGDYANVTSPVTITSSGLYYFRAVSASGVISDNEVVYQAQIDTVKPVISDISGHTGDWVNKNRVVKFKVTDTNSKVQHAVISSAPENIYPPKITCTDIECEFVATTNGEYVVQVEDHAGNMSDPTTIKVERIDKSTLNVRAIVLDRTQLVQKAKIQVDLLAVGESQLKSLAVEYRKVESEPWGSKGTIPIKADSDSVIYEADANGFYRFIATNNASSFAISNVVEVTKVSNVKPSVSAVFTYRDEHGEAQSYPTDGSMWVNSRVDVVLSSDQSDVRYEMSLDGTTYEQVTGNKVTFDQNMECDTVKFKAISQSDVASDETGPYTVLIHQGTPDQPKLTVPADFKDSMWYAYSKTMNVTFTANTKPKHSFSETVELSINDGVWNPLAGTSYNPADTFNGANEMRFRVVDSAGNVSEITKGYLNIDRTQVSAQLKVEKDNSVGILELLTQGRFFHKTTKVHVVGSAGASGVATTYYELSDQAHPYDPVRLQEGSSFYVEPNFKGSVHGLVINHALVENPISNAPYDRYVSASSQVDDIVVDSELPEITYVYPSAWTSQKTIEVTIKDEYATLKDDAIFWYVEGEADQKQAISLDQAGKVTLTVPKEGSYNIIIEAADKAGNIALKTIPVQFDETKPKLSAYTFTPGESEWTNKTKKLVFTIEEPVSGLVGDVAFTKGNSTIYAYRQPDGSYQAEFAEVGTYDLTLTDGAGNELTTAVSISHIDPNKTTLISSADQSKYQKELEINLSYDAGVIPEVSKLVSVDVVYSPFNDGPQPAKSVDIATMKYMAKANGTYVFTATNEAGTIATSSITINHVDAAIPELKVRGYVGDQELASGTWTNQAVKLVIENVNKEVKSVKLKRKLDHDAYTDFVGDWTEMITDSHKVTYQAISENGEASNEVSYDVLIDRDAPTISNVTNTGSLDDDAWKWKKRTITFEGNDTGGSGLHDAEIISVPDGAAIPVVKTGTSATYSFSAADNGDYVVRLYDIAGNYVDQTITVAKIISTMPSISAEPDDLSTYRKEVTFNITYTLFDEVPLDEIQVCTVLKDGDTCTSEGVDVVSDIKATYITKQNGTYYFKVVTQATKEDGSVIEARTRNFVVDKLSQDAPTMAALYEYYDTNEDTWKPYTSHWVNTTIKARLYNTNDAWNSGKLTYFMREQTLDGTIGEWKQVNDEVSFTSDTFTHGYVQFKAQAENKEESDEIPWMKLRQDMQKPSMPLIKDEKSHQSWYAYDKQVEVNVTNKSDRYDPAFTEALYVALDDGQWEEMKTNIWIPRPTLEGMHKLSFQLVDSAGNASSIKELWIKLDKVMPEVSMRITNDAGSELLSQLTGGYFYNEVQRIDLETSTIGESDVRNLYHQKGLTLGTWIKGTSFNLYPQFVGNLYGKIENNALDETGAYVSNETVISNVMIETQKPTLRVTYPSGWSEESRVSVYAEDGQSDLSFVNWTLEDVTTPIKLSEGKGSFVLPKEGAYELLIKAQDRSGNVKEVPLQVKYDKTDPTLSIDEVDSTLSDVKDIRFTVSDGESGIDVQSIYIQNAKGKVLPFAKQRDGSYVVSVEENGTYSIEVSDLAGHTTIKEVEVHSIHTDGPAITIAASSTLGDKESDSWVKNSRDIAFYVNPVVGLDKITVTNAYGEKQRVTRNKDTGEYHFTVTENGAYSIQAADAYGNTSTLDLTIGKIAKRSPVIRLETNEKQWQNSFDVNAYVFAKDAPLTDQPVHVYYKENQSANWGSVVTKLALQDQSNYASYTVRQNGYYRFVVVDQAGYESEEVLHVTSIDNASAQTKVTMKNMCTQEPYEVGTWTNCDVELTLSNGNSDVQNKQLRYEYLEGTAIDAMEPVWQKVEDPEHFLVEAKGTSIKRYLFRAVNGEVVEAVSKTDVKTIKIDKTKPQTPVVVRRDLFEEDDWYRASTSIAFEADRDEGSAWSLQRDLGDGNGFTSEGVDQSAHTWTNDQAGSQKVRFRYMDEAGNVSSTTQAYVNIDPDAPSLHITMSEDTSANLLSLLTGNVYKKSVKGTIHASGTHAPIRSVRYRILPSNTKETDIKWIDGNEFVIPADFKGTVVAQAESYNGLKQEVTMEEFIVDQSGPEIILPNEANTIINDPTLRIQIKDSLSGLTEASYQDRSATSPVSISLPIKEGKVDETITLPDGMHVLTISASDMAGNTTNRSFVMDIDTTGPEITVFKQSDGWKEERQVCFNANDERSSIASQAVMFQDTSLPLTQSDNKQCFTVTENGEYTIHAEDALGNASSYTYYETRIDHGIPQIKLMNATDDPWVHGSRDVSFAVSKGLVGIDEVYISDESDTRIDVTFDYETDDENIYQVRLQNNGAYVIHAFTPGRKEGTYPFHVQKIDQGVMAISVDALDQTPDTQVKATLHVSASDSPMEGVRVYYAQDSDHEETLLETLSPTMIQEDVLETIIKRNGSYRFEAFNACGDTISSDPVEVDWLLSTATITDVTMTTTSDLAYVYGTWSRENIKVSLRNVNPDVAGAAITWQMRKNKAINAHGEEDWQTITESFTIETETMISDSYEFRGVIGNVVEHASIPYVVNIDKTNNATPEIIKAEQYGEAVWFANNTEISASFKKKKSTIKETLQVSIDDGRTWSDVRTCSTLDTLEADGTTCKGTYTQSKAGKVAVTFRVVDEAGNHSKAVAQMYVNIDRMTPSVEIELKESAVNELMNNLTLHQYFNKTIHGSLNTTFGAGGGEVYYQLVASGKAYDDRSWIHGDEFVIEPNWKGELYAKAVSVSGLSTIVHYDNVIIADDEAPRIKLPVNDHTWKTDNTYEIKVSDNLSGLDLSQFYMKINDGGPQYLSSLNNVLRLPDGAYELSVTAYDLAENHDTQTRSILIDTVKPVITVDALDTQIAAYQDVTFSIEDATSGVDPTRISVMDEQGTLLEVSSVGANAYTFRAQHSGTYEIKAYDIAGNQADSTFVDITNVDDEAPVIQTVTISPDQATAPWVSDQRTVRFEVIEDGIGLRGGQPVVTRGKELIPLTQMNDTFYEFIADQNADYIITAQDQAGNKAEDMIVEVEGIDASAPSNMLVQITERKESVAQQILNTLTLGKFFNDGFEVTLTAKDEESHVASFTWWYGDEQNKGEEHVITTDQDKVKFFLEDITQQDVISAYATNHAGLTSAIASSTPVTNEATLPKVSVVSGSKTETGFVKDQEDVYRAERYWLEVSASDTQSGLAKIEYSYRDGAGIVSDRYTLWTVSEADGIKKELTTQLELLEDLGTRLGDDTRVPINQITFYVTDRSGNEQTLKKAIFLDLEAPRFVEIKQPQGTSFMKEKRVEMTITDDRSGIKEVRGVDPNENPITITKNEAGVYEFTALENGEYLIEAEDEVGNIRTQSIRVSHVDSSKMEVTELKGHTSAEGEKWASGKRIVSFHISVGTSGLAKEYPIVLLDGVHKVPLTDLGYGDYSFTTTIMGEYTIQLKNNAGVIYERKFIVDKIDENDPVIEFVQDK